MYSRRVVNARLEQLAVADRANPAIAINDRFEPQDYSREYVESWSKHLAANIDDDGKLRRLWTTEERRWMRHQQMQSTADFLYWATRYAKINDYTNRLSSFTPNVAQRLVLQEWGDLEDRELAIMMLQLKARQLGVTTLTELAIAHRVQFYPDVNAVVSSADPDKSDKMAQMIDLCWAHEPAFIMPKKTRDSAKVVEFGALNSGLSIQHGSQLNGIARGTTPTVVHLSEVASYVNPVDLIEASLVRAIHETPWVFVIMESTAEGMNNYWHLKWLQAKADWPRQRSRFCPCFLPWFIGRDIYPTPSWLRKQPIPGGWVPSDMVIAHAERAAAYVQSSPRLTLALGSNWVLPREQIWFYESEYESAKKGGTLSKFLAEMPADDFEAFQSSNPSVFERETIEIYTNETARRNPVGVYGIVGTIDEIPLRLHPSASEIDTSRRRIPIKCEWGGNRQMYSTYELVPLNYYGYTDTDPQNKLFVWEWPSGKESYAVSVDTSDGVGQDNAAIEAMRKGTVFRGPAQVAEFVSNEINAFNLWPMALCISTLFSPNKTQARSIIECRGTGEAVQLELRKRGWHNFHPWQRYDSKNLDPARSNKLGWYTSSWSRDLMIDLIISALNDQWLEITSPYFVQEMRTLANNGGRIEAEGGSHDDRIMSLAMCLVTLHMLELRGFQSRRRDGDRLSTTRKPDPAADDPVYDPGWQGRDCDRSQISGYMKTMGVYYRDLARRHAQARRMRGVR